MRILLISLFILVMVQRASADAIYDKCIEEAQTGIDATVCAYDAYDRLDGELGKLQQDLLKQHGENSHEPLEDYEKIVLSHLHDEQEKWEEYRKSACQFFGATEEVNGTHIRIFGSMGLQYQFPACYVRVIEQRIEILRHQLCPEFDPRDDTCP